ncbi:MAG: glutathione S-transferase family protein [Paracoccaceae bacterium]
MKLYYGGTSPYVRKVVVVASECGLDDRIEREVTLPWEAGSKYGGVNPVGKVPALITDEGQLLYDSPVIVEYLDSLHDGPKLIPASGTERFEALRIAALADGMMDAVILLFAELTRRPPELHWQFWDDRMRGTVARSLDALEQDAAGFDPARPDVAQISTAVGLGWIEFRLSVIGIDFRDGHPKLSEWFDAFSERASMQGSMPKAH